MNVAGLAKEVRGLAARVAEGFAQVDSRFEAIDQRFDTMRADVRSDLEEFASRIERRFQFLMEKMRGDFKAAFDRSTANAERLERFEREHAEIHRLMQVQIQELDAELLSRRRLRRRKS